MKKKLIVFLLALSLLLPCFALTSFAAPEATPEIAVNTKVEFKAFLYANEMGGAYEGKFPLNINDDDGVEYAEMCFWISANEPNCTLKKIEKINGTTVTLVESKENNKYVNLIADKVLPYTTYGPVQEYRYRYVKFNSPEDANRELTFRLTWVNKDGIEGTSECKFYTTIILENSMAFGVYPDKNISVPDSEIKITYYIEKWGNPVRDDLSFFTLTDESLSGLVPSTTLITPQELLAQDSITKTITIKPQKNLILAPRIFYSLNNKVYEESPLTLPIIVGEMVPEVTLTCEDYSPDKAGSTQIFNYTIKNNNPVPIENIRIYDSDADDAKLIYGPFTLGSGEEYSGSYEVSVWNSGYYKCKLTFKSTSDLDTTELSIRSDKQIILPADVSFKITAISPETITESGYVTFNLLIENGTANMLENLIISEENNLFAPVSLNVSIPSAIGAKKSTTSKEISVLITSPKTNLNFILSYAVDGVSKTIELPYEVNFNTSLEVPSDNVTQVDNAKKDNSLLVWILVCVCILIIITFFIILLFVLRSRSKVDKHTPALRRRVVEDYEDEYFDDEELEDEFDDEGVKIFKKNN